MPVMLNAQEPAIVRAIKTVGVGKKGSKPLDPAIIDELLLDVQHRRVSPAALGAFLGGLLMKGVEPHEAVLESAFGKDVFNDPKRLLEILAPEAPEAMHRICERILRRETLNKSTAKEMGQFLFSNQPGDVLRGLIASVLRVRYESDDEYEGLWEAIQATFHKDFCSLTPEGDPIVQIAEPFDGNDHSYMITPVVAGFIQSLGYRSIHVIGRNSGPKLVMNLYEVLPFLPDIVYARSNQALANQPPLMGWFIRQQDLSPALDRWVDVRRQTVKRPFLATLEKFVRPLDARIIIASAFHPPYGEKMLTIAERAGFPGVIIVRNGMEGSIAFPLKRPVKILMSARQLNNTYVRHEINLDPESLGIAVDVEEHRGHLTAQDNARLIQHYFDYGTSHDPWVDERIRFTCEGLKQALQWVRENIR